MTSRRGVGAVIGVGACKCEYESWRWVWRKNCSWGALRECASLRLSTRWRGR